MTGVLLRPALRRSVRGGVAGAKEAGMFWHAEEREVRDGELGEKVGCLRPQDVFLPERGQWKRPSGVIPTLIWSWYEESVGGEDVRMEDEGIR